VIIQHTLDTLTMGFPTFARSSDVTVAETTRRSGPGMCRAFSRRMNVSAMQRAVILLAGCVLTQACGGLEWLIVPPAALGAQVAGRAISCAMHDEAMDRALERQDLPEADTCLRFIRLNCLQDRYNAAFGRYQAYLQRQREAEALRRCQPTVDRINASWRNPSFRAQAAQVRALCARDVEQQIAERGQTVEGSCKVALRAIVGGNRAGCATYPHHCAPEDVKQMCGAP